MMEKDEEILYKEDWLNVNDVPTKFQTWGTRVEDLSSSTADSRYIILMITGNPGVIEFYKDFLDVLYKRIRIPIWAVSHAGHVCRPPSRTKTSNRTLYDLQQQVDHKAAIIRNYVPKDFKIIIIGHSLGAKIAVELLKMDDIEKNLVKCFLLFPTLERIEDTPNGQFIKPVIRYFGSTLVFLSWVFTMLPNVVQYYLLNTTFRLAYGNSSECVVQGGIQLIKPDVLKNVFYLVKDEMIKIKELDTDVLNSCKNKLKFYFGTTDGWSPLEYCYNLKEKIPDVDATVCSLGMKHAFAIQSGQKMAELISEWISELL